MDYNLPPTSQIQIQKQKEIDELEQKYVVFQDLKNFLCIVTETQAVFELLGENHELTTIHLNRLICQLNLSNSIHADTYRNCYKSNTIHSLQIVKNSGIALYNKFKEQYYYHLNPKIQQYIELYEVNALYNNGSIQQIPIQFSKQQKFSNDSLQKLINAFAEVDQVYQDIREGKYQVDQSYESFNQILQMKSLRAKEKIADFIMKESIDIPKQNDKLKQNNTQKQNDIPITKEWQNLLQNIVNYSLHKSEENQQMLQCTIESLMHSDITMGPAIQQNITRFNQKIRNQELMKYMIQLQVQFNNQSLNWKQLEIIKFEMFREDMDVVQQELKN